MTEKYCIENDFAAQKELAEIERHNSEPIWEKNKALIARVARLEEAVRPVVEWYTRSKRHFPGEFRPRDIALEYDGPHGRIKVACLELDALAALVGEE